MTQPGHVRLARGVRSQLDGVGCSYVLTRGGVPRTRRGGVVAYGTPVHDTSHVVAACA